MSWLILIISGAFEAVWATALAKSDGFTRPVPVIVFLVAAAISMSGLAWAMRELPTGTSYAVWVAVGATTTVLWAMLTGAEAVSLAKIVFLAMIIGGVVGLKAVS